MSNSQEPDQEDRIAGSGPKNCDSEPEFVPVHEWPKQESRGLSCTQLRFLRQVFSAVFGCVSSLLLVWAAMRYFPSSEIAALPQQVRHPRSVKEFSEPSIPDLQATAVPKTHESEESSEAELAPDQRLQTESRKHESPPIDVASVTDEEAATGSILHIRSSDSTREVEPPQVAENDTEKNLHRRNAPAEPIAPGKIDLRRKVRIVSKPDDSQIIVNRKNIERRTIAFAMLEPGDRVQLVHAGYEPYEFTVQRDTTVISADLDEITRFTMHLHVKTANQKNAGTDDSIRSYLNGDPQHERNLNHGDDDRRVGAIDKYHLEFVCPVKQLRGIRIHFKAGDDAWKVESVSAQMVKRDGSVSQVFQATFNRWLSADRGEGAQYLDLSFRNPRFVDPSTE